MDERSCVTSFPTSLKENVKEYERRSTFGTALAACLTLYQSRGPPRCPGRVPSDYQLSPYTQAIHCRLGRSRFQFDDNDAFAINGGDVCNRPAATRCSVPDSTIAGFQLLIRLQRILEITFQRNLSPCSITAIIYSAETSSSVSAIPASS